MTDAGLTADPLFFAFQQAFAGRYSIDRELGRGGTGIVYLAREVHLDRSVAIKVLPPERARDASLRERFLREARLAGKLSHPNIIPIHAVEERGEFVFFVMAFIDGETLTQRVRARGPLSASEGARVLREVAWALAYAHAQGFVHRDVKPDNILIETGTGRVLVADFGIAAVAGDGPAEAAGTPEFMSPEQVLGTAIDARTDIYGLGATAFYALSGRFPFEGATHTEVLAKQVTEQAPALGSLGLTVPRKLAALVDKCLMKEPASRPQSADAVANHLSAALERRKELPAALRQFVKRHARMNSGGTLLVCIALLPVSIGISAWLGMVAGFSTFILGAIVAPAIYMTAAARRLMHQGFAMSDLEPAFRAEVEQANEELAVDRRAGPSWLQPVMKRIVQLSAAVSGTGVVAYFVLTKMRFEALARIPRFPAGSVVTKAMGAARYQTVLDVSRYYGHYLNLSINWASLSGGVAFLAGIWFLSLAQRERDVDTQFWSRLWLGRWGRAAFAMAKRFMGKRALAPAMTHRATELSLGLAAEQLYESLPKAAREGLGDLPQVLTRLQEDAQSLRKRYDGLQEALSEAGEAAQSEAFAEVRDARDEIHAKLGDAVGALESIRLNLLRLHAGATTVESITTHLGLAAEVSAEVERLIAAHGDIERALRFPRVAAATPV